MLFRSQTALLLLAEMEERPEETVDVVFTLEADRQPLDDADRTEPGPQTPSTR